MDAIKFLVVFAVAVTSAVSVASVVPNRVPEGRITNGHTSAANQFPYQAELRVPDESGFFTTFKWCTGSIISSNWILTSASCTHGARTVNVYLGNIEHAGFFRRYTFHLFRRDIWEHPQYSHTIKINDISLIKTPNITFSASIQSVKLPSIVHHHPTYIGETVVVSGWGMFQDSHDYVINDLAPTLQFAEMNVTTDEECSSRYFYYYDSNICVSTRGHLRSICMGDAGAPLVANVTDVLVQIGIASYTARPCGVGYPNVFTRITHHLRWIRHVTKIWYLL